MTEPEDVLLARLREASAAQDRPPPEVYEMARAAFALRSLDAELATLVADSLDSVGAVRGPGQARVLVFESDALTIDLEVSPAGQGRRLLGQTTPPAAAAVVETLAGTRQVELDGAGRFVCEEVPAGPMRVRASVPARSVATAWTLV